MTKKKPLKRKGKIFKRSITKKRDLISEKFNTSLKGKKIDIGKSVKNFFDWIKGAEIVELPNCNTNEDPVRPELDNDFRTSFFKFLLLLKASSDNARNRDDIYFCAFSFFIPLLTNQFDNEYKIS